MFRAAQLANITIQILKHVQLVSFHVWAAADHQHFAQNVAWELNYSYMKISAKILAQQGLWLTRLLTIATNAQTTVRHVVFKQPDVTHVTQHQPTIYSSRTTVSTLAQ